MNKLEVQQRVLQNGIPLDLDKFSWDEDTKTFSTNKNVLVVDMMYIDKSTQTAGNCSTQTAGDESTCISSFLSKVIATGDNVVARRTDIIDVAILNNGYVKNGLYSENGQKAIIADGILSFIIKQKGDVYHVKNYGEDIESYLIKQGDIYSHGCTLKEAKDSLKYKISSQDTSIYTGWNI